MYQGKNIMEEEHSRGKLSVFASYQPRSKKGRDLGVWEVITFKGIPPVTYFL
jgi:hypothetical protein